MAKHALLAFPGVIFKGPLHTINIWGTPMIGPGTQIGAYVEIGDDVVIGEDCVIGAYTFIPPKVRIGNRVWIGPRVTFSNDKYPPSSTLIETHIADDCIIGIGALICPGAHLAPASRIGAGAVVVHGVPPGHSRAWYVGNPARPVA